MIDNACYWIEEFHLDGLRLDAVHAIIDDSDTHVLQELADKVREAACGRHVHIIVENEENQATLLEREGGHPTCFTAQWNDDVHHALHTGVTGEDSGYYIDYLGDATRLGRALAEGFAFQGDFMRYRDSTRGQPSVHLPPVAFTAFIQNHDQVGNRALGERIGMLATPEAVRAIAAVYLLLPQIPMLFMGEEWSAQQPFPYFCDFQGELADAVRAGRRGEFSKFPGFATKKQQQKIPDPQSEATFLSAKLDWMALEEPPHRDWIAWYQSLLSIRKTEIIPLLSSRISHGGNYEIISDGPVVVRWDCASAGTLELAANLSHRNANGMPESPGRVLFQHGQIDEGGHAEAWAVRWSLK